MIAKDGGGGLYGIATAVTLPIEILISFTQQLYTCVEYNKMRNHYRIILWVGV